MSDLKNRDRITFQPVATEFAHDVARRIVAQSESYAALGKQCAIDGRKRSGGKFGKRAELLRHAAEVIDDLVLERDALKLRVG